MRILVTGCCGFIGSHLVDALEKKNSEAFEDGMKELVEWSSKQNAADRFDAANKELKDGRLV